MPIMENLYEIMECSEDASFEKLRQNYQKLVLRYHPDKNIDNVSNEKFVKVKKAWDILSDKKLKEDYDIKWKQRKVAQNFPIQNEVHIDEFDEDDELFLTNECRCGGLYILSETDVKFCCDIVCCDTCTLSVKVIYSDQT